MKLTRFFSAVGITFAMALTLSCAGYDGTDGADGTGCSLDDKGVEFSVKCGNEEAKWAKAWCGEVAYDPKKNVCYNTILGVKIGEQIWMTEDYVARGTDGKYTWAEASTICPIDWTLPGKAEFEELINGVTTVAGLVAKGFSAKASDEWWSGESYNNVSSSYAYFLKIDELGEVIVNNESKSNSKAVRCIRK